MLWDAKPRFSASPFFAKRRRPMAREGDYSTSADCLAGALGWPTTTLPTRAAACIWCIAGAGCCSRQNFVFALRQHTLRAMLRHGIQARRHS